MKDEIPRKTVKGLLITSLSSEPIAEGNFNSIFAIKAPEFNNYLLRVKNGCRRTLLANLESTSALTPAKFLALTVPDFLFTGPNVSQSLLHLDSNKTDDPILEIIPKQEGIMLCDYILGRDGSFTHDEQNANRLGLMKELGHPDSNELEKIFLQAVFVSQQPPSPPCFDVNDGTVMVEKDSNGVRLHLVDIVGQENIDRDGSHNEMLLPFRDYVPPAPKRSIVSRILMRPPPIPEVDPNDVARHAMREANRRMERKKRLCLANPNNPVFPGIALFLNEYLRNGLTAEQLESDTVKQFSIKLVEAFDHTMAAFEKDEIPREWKGFQRMIKPDNYDNGIPDDPSMESAGIHMDDGEACQNRRISAVNLSDSPHALLDTLNRIKGLAITEENCASRR
jgi:hypothetical protein